MIDYMKRHERYVREMLEKNLSPEALADLLAYHDKQIQWMQHERFVHLIIMLFVCLFTLLTWGFTFVMPSIACFILSALLLILTIAYIIHYYRLENGVQKWYELSDQIRLRRR
jgi:predicted RND superfamily exporter protein